MGLKKAARYVTKCHFIIPFPVGGKKNNNKAQAESKTAKFRMPAVNYE
jgi:hypothetical protein